MKKKNKIFLLKIIIKADPEILSKSYLYNLTQRLMADYNIDVRPVLNQATKTTSRV